MESGDYETLSGGFSQPRRQASRLAVTCAASSNIMFVCAHDYVAILINGYLKKFARSIISIRLLTVHNGSIAESKPIVEEMFDFNILKRKFQHVTFLV